MRIGFQLFVSGFKLVVGGGYVQSSDPPKEGIMRTVGTDRTESLNIGNITRWRLVSFIPTRAAISNM